LLKARAHALEPVVIIGGKGLTDDVVKEVDRELIKVRAPVIERVVREETMNMLCQRTGAVPVQIIGKVFVMFRKKDEQT